MPSNRPQWMKTADRVMERWLKRITDTATAAVVIILGILVIGNFRTITDDLRAFQESEDPISKGMALIIMVGLVAMMAVALGLVSFIGRFNAWVFGKAEKQSHVLPRIILHYIGIAPMAGVLHLLYTGGIMKTDAGHREILIAILLFPFIYEVGRGFRQWRKNRKPITASHLDTLPFKT